MASGYPRAAVCDFRPAFTHVIYKEENADQVEHDPEWRFEQLEFHLIQIFERDNFAGCVRCTTVERVHPLDPGENWFSLSFFFKKHAPEGVQREAGGKSELGNVHNDE